MVKKRFGLTLAHFSLFGIPLFSLLFGCSEDPADSLFDPNEQLAPRPVVASFDPPDSSFAGAGVLSLNGQNFSPVLAENQVFFNNVKAQVLSASETQIQVLPPNLVADSIRIRVAVQQAELFSEDRFYKLLAAVSDFGKIFEGDIAYGVASDLDGNVYFHVQGGPIKKVTPDNVTSDLTPGRTIFLRANAMKLGPGNLLYVAPSGRNKIIMTVSLQDGAQALYVSLGPRTLQEPRDLDFDSSLNLWVVGGQILFRVKPDLTVTQAATFPGNLLSIRIFSDFVYTVGNDDTTGESRIWRAPIQTDGVGEIEEVLNLATTPELEGAVVQALTFSEGGDMVLGTTHPSGIFIVSQSGSVETLFPGLFQPEVYAFSWSVEDTPIVDGQVLYAVRQRRSVEVPSTFDLSQVFRISMPTRSATYFGR